MNKKFWLLLASLAAIISYQPDVAADTSAGEALPHNTVIVGDDDADTPLEPHRSSPTLPQPAGAVLAVEPTDDKKGAAAVDNLAVSASDPSPTLVAPEKEPSQPLSPALHEVVIEDDATEKASETSAVSPKVSEPIAKEEQAVSPPSLTTQPATDQSVLASSAERLTADKGEEVPSDAKVAIEGAEKQGTPITTPKLEQAWVEDLLLDPKDGVVAEFVADLYPDETRSDASLVSLARDGLLPTDLFAELVQSGKLKTFADLEVYFYNKLDSDTRLWEYFYTNLGKDKLLSTYFESVKTLELPDEVWTRTPQELNKLKSYFYQTLQKDKFFRDYFYRSETDRPEELTERELREGSSFYAMWRDPELHSSGRRTPKKRKPVPQPKPKPRPEPYRPPVTTPGRPHYTLPAAPAKKPTPPARTYHSPVSPPNRPTPSIVSRDEYAPFAKNWAKLNRITSSSHQSRPSAPTYSLPSSWEPKAVSQPVLTSPVRPSRRDQVILDRVNAQGRKNYETYFKPALQVAGELTGVNDAYRLVNGVDPFTGEKVSRLEAGVSLAANFIPAGKLVDTGLDAIRLGKAADTALDAKKLYQFNRATGTVHASKTAVEAARVSKGAQAGTWLAKGNDLAFDAGRTLKHRTKFIKQADGTWLADVEKPSRKFLKADDIEFSDKFKQPNYSNQVTKRGWTNQKIAETINNPVKTSSSFNKYTGNTVTNYYINDTHYVAVDDVTGKVLQVANLNKSWKGPQ